jgi:cytochrome c-type biogenesis protein CcmH/NrfG
MDTVSQKNIFMMEDHDKALSVWRGLGVRGRTLVHIDAHIDFAWLPEMDLDEMAPQTSRELEILLKEQPLWNPWKKSRRSMVHIGNYIAPALTEGIVEKVYWVIPDPTWESRYGRKRILKNIRWLLKAEKIGCVPIIEKDHIYFRIANKDFFVCSLKSLPRLDEAVLLDIDVDFLMTPYVWRDLDVNRQPWLLPRELYGHLAEKNVLFDALTISYSVEGGFTPIEYKYFGDEIRQFFDGPQDEESRRLTVIKKEASACFAAAMRYASDPSADLEKAKENYAKAIALDPSYGSAFNNYGIIYLEKGKFALAKKEFEKILRLDKNNIDSLNGLGFIALHQKKFQKAKEYFKSVLAMDVGDLPACLGLGAAHFKTGDINEAEALFRSMKDKASQYPEVFWWQGRLSEQRGDIEAALYFYKEAVLWGEEGPGVHFRILCLCLRKRMFTRAFEEFKRFARLWMLSIVSFG